MIDLSKLVLIIPSVLPFNHEANINDFYSGPICIVCEPELMNTIPQRVYTNTDLIEDNTDQIIQQLYRVSIENEQ